MKNFLARITPPCKETTRLLSESMDRTLPLFTWMQVRVHLLICEGCRRYRDQLRAIRNMLHRTSAQSHGQDTTHLPTPSPESQERLKRALERRRP